MSAVHSYELTEPRDISNGVESGPDVWLNALEPVLSQLLSSETCPFRIIEATSSAIAVKNIVDVFARSDVVVWHSLALPTT